MPDNSTLRFPVPDSSEKAGQPALAEMVFFDENGEIDKERTQYKQVAQLSAEELLQVRDYHRNRADVHNTMAEYAERLSKERE